MNSISPIDSRWPLDDGLIDQEPRLPTTTSTDRPAGARRSQGPYCSVGESLDSIDLDGSERGLGSLTWDTEEVRVVSLNAWGGARFNELASWLPECGADVLCLQEVTRTPGLGGTTEFADGERTLPQRANLFDDVRELLPRHQAMFLASDAGPVTDSDGRTHRQDFGIAVFVAETNPVIAHQSSFIHGSFADHAEWAINDRPRVAQAIRIVDRNLDRQVTVVHAHGLRDPAGKHDTDARRSQAERLAELVVATRSLDDIVVVCGDLNLLPDSETFSILGEVGLIDLVGEQDTRTSSYLKPIRHANYLLISHPQLVKKFEAPGNPEVSDHRPLILDL